MEKLTVFEGEVARAHAETAVKRVLFIGDPHFKLKNVEYIPLFVSRILEVVNRCQVDFVVIAGDLLDNHDKVDVEPLNLAVEFVDSVRKIVRTFVLVGNHDYKNNQQFLTTNHWMNAMKNWSNVTIVDDVVEFDNFLFLPYVFPGRFLEALETKISRTDLCRFVAVFAHQEFRGCKMGVVKSTIGDVWLDEWPLVVSGHIHEKQWSQSNVYYPGSAMQHAFGQSVENTVSVIEWSRLEDGTTAMNFDEIDLAMPKMVIKYLSVQEATEPLKWKQTDFKKYKLVVRGEQSDLEAFKMSSRRSQLLAEGFKIVFRLVERPSDEHLRVADSRQLKTFETVLHEKVVSENNRLLDGMLKKYM